MSPGISGNVLTDGEFLGAESLPYHGVRGLRRKHHTETAPGSIYTLRGSVVCDDLSFFWGGDHLRRSVQKKTVITKSLP